MRIKTAEKVRSKKRKEEKPGEKKKPDSEASGFGVFSSGFALQECCKKTIFRGQRIAEISLATPKMKTLT